jgi:hypothetical protein
MEVSSDILVGGADDLLIIAYHCNSFYPNNFLCLSKSSFSWSEAESRNSKAGKIAGFPLSRE